MIEDITREVEKGKIYEAKVIRIEEYGCFIELWPGCEGMVHISQLAHERVNKVEDVVHVGDEILVKALGKDRVIGVTIPNVVQTDEDILNQDLSDVKKLVNNLDIKLITIPLSYAYCDILNNVENALGENNVTEQTKINLAPRLRMSILYAVSQSHNGRVVNTCNLSEDWVGYSTRYGDAAGDFSPMSDFTVEEVKQIGAYLGLPKKFIEKPPIDGLCGKTDEDNLGFTYQTLDDYIRRGIEPAPDIKKLIDEKHKNNLFKLSFMPVFRYKAD